MVKNSADEQSAFFFFAAVSFAQSKSFFVTKSGNRRLSPSGQVVRHEDEELVQGIEHDRGDIVHTEPEPRMNAQVRLRWYCEAHLIRLNPGSNFYRMPDSYFRKNSIITAPEKRYTLLHNEDDGMWQFLCGEVHQTDDAMTSCLWVRPVIQREKRCPHAPSLLLILFGLPYTIR